MSFRTGFLVRNPVFGKRRSLASGAHWARDDKSLNHQNLPDTVLGALPSLGKEPLSGQPRDCSSPKLGEVRRGWVVTYADKKKIRVLPRKSASHSQNSSGIPYTAS